jgi:hypothetical protein
MELFSSAFDDSLYRIANWEYERPRNPGSKILELNSLFLRLITGSQQKRIVPLNGRPLHRENRAVNTTKENDAYALGTDFWGTYSCVQPLPVVPTGEQGNPEAAQA